jgi:hypothetical protein
MDMYFAAPLCELRFEADRTVTIVFRTREYSRGYGSSYLASLAARKLGVPLDRIRLYFAGAHPAVRRTPCQARIGEDSGPRTVLMGLYVERLCDRAMEQRGQRSAGPD